MRSSRPDVDAVGTRPHRGGQRLTVDKVIASEVQDGTAVGMATAIVILKSA